MDEITKKLEKRNAELQSIEDSLERLHRRAMRTMNAIDKLRARKKYILKGRHAKAATCKVDSKEWHRIRNEVELDDAYHLESI